MNGIVGLANVLRKTSLDQEQNKYLSAIQKSAHSLMQIIDDLLDFSKMSANQFTFEESEFNLQELVQDIVDLIDDKARERNNRLAVFIDTDVPARLGGDQLRLRQVILNLVRNAIKFTENGKINILVSSLKKVDDLVLLEFTVEDTGVGIPEEKLHAVFESFNQGSNDITRKYGGTGLGLTISKNIVEMQGGTISVRSQPQVGSTFTFSMPFRNVSAKDIVPISISGPLKEENTVAPKLSDISDIKVLLAEDDEINQLLINTIFADWAIEIDTVNNGLEALEKILEKPYDLVLMDMQMPEMDGFEAIKVIRSLNSINASLPIIALTAHTSQLEINRILAAGASAYISKPFEPDALFSTMVRLVNSESKYKGASVNMKDLRGMVGNNSAFLVEALAMYIESIPVAVRRLNQLIKDGSLEEAKIHLSELYDSISVLSAKPLQFTFERLTSALIEANIPLLIYISEQAITECDELVELLQQEYSRVHNGL